MKKQTPKYKRQEVMGRLEPTTETHVEMPKRLYEMLKDPRLRQEHPRVFQFYQRYKDYYVRVGR